MTEIKVLDKSIFNRIAAGEVVERPASIVKELVENAIDAGATNISVTVKGGGVDYIRVTDNGKGIGAADIKTAFLPHATSKISKVEDLDGIATLGFRGEALPSIAAVSRITMTSRREFDELGCRYSIDNGVEMDYGEIGAPYGTSVVVENLFDRIPARKKFLSKNSVEENAITNLIERFILSHSDIAFKYTVNDKNVYVSGGSGTEDAINTVYGGDYLKNMLKIDSTMSSINLYGYVNKPSFTKHSKSFQTLIVNGRYVINDEISYTIYGCYQKYLMKRQYPTYVLYLDVPYDLVDVNVHPNKMQVKFAVPGMIKKLIADAIKEQVLQSTGIPKDVSGDSIFSFYQLGENEENSCFTPQRKAIEENGFTVYTPIIKEYEPQPSNVQNQSSNERETTKIPRSTEFRDPFSCDSITDKGNEPLRSTALTPDAVDKTTDEERREARVDSSALGEIPSFSIEENRDQEPVSTFSERKSTVNDLFFAASTQDQERFDIKPSAKVVGKLFNTYIVIESDNNVYLIDQHAAHEKLLYDKYVAECELGSVAVQHMLIPYEFSVSPEENEIIENNLLALASAGFNVTPYKKPNSYLLKTVPLCCVGLNAKTFIGDFLKDNLYETKKMLPDAFKEKLMQHACKAATKGEDDLSEFEVQTLIDQMRSDMKELFCPHGRPVVVKLTRSEIEKWFKRIV